MTRPSPCVWSSERGEGRGGKGGRREGRERDWRERRYRVVIYVRGRRKEKGTGTMERENGGKREKRGN